MVIISPPQDQTYLGTNTQIELSDILALHNELTVVSSINYQLIDQDR